MEKISAMHRQFGERIRLHCPEMGKIPEDLGIRMGISYRYQNRGVASEAIRIVIILLGLKTKVISFSASLSK
jgi:hypothetical protein